MRMAVSMPKMDLNVPVTFSSRSMPTMAAKPYSFKSSVRESAAGLSLGGSDMGHAKLVVSVYRLVLDGDQHAGRRGGPVVGRAQGEIASGRGGGQDDVELEQAGGDQTRKLHYGVDRADSDGGQRAERSGLRDRSAHYGLGDRSEAVRVEHHGLARLGGRGGAGEEAGWSNQAIVGTVLRQDVRPDGDKERWRERL